MIFIYYWILVLQSAVRIFPPGGGVSRGLSKQEMKNTRSKNQHHDKKNSLSFPLKSFLASQLFLASIIYCGYLYIICFGKFYLTTTKFVRNDQKA